MAESYRFGPFELHVARLELWRNGTSLRIEPKPLEVLIELLRHAGELVTKSELMDTVWAGRVVTESVIARCINKVRDALDDESQTLILNVHGYGYRYTGIVEAMAEAPSPAPQFRPASGDALPLRPNWRLVRPLDHAATVWLAEHAKTSNRRVFKFAVTESRIRSLRRELTINRLLVRGLGAQAGVARVYDYNLSVLPYYLELEYCAAGNFADWLAARGGVATVPMAERLALVAELAESLAAAHALGVLHMDVKPSNVLVDFAADGQPCLRWSDFGSARLLEPERLADFGITHLDLTLADAARSIGGTLNYVAPELLRGEAPSVRSDLYAMGVLLYQMVAGDLRLPVAAGWERNVADPLLRSDIAAAANDDPAARPHSAADFAAHLRSIEDRRDELAAIAQRDAETRRLRERVERARARRPWAVAASVLLVLGLAASLWGYRTVAVARDTARTQADLAAAVIAFLEKDVLGLGSPFSVGDTGPESLTIRDAIDRAAKTLSTRFADQPGVESALRATIGEVYRANGDVVGAERELRRAVLLGRDARGQLDERGLRAAFTLATTLCNAVRFAEARQLLDEANATFETLPVASITTRLARDVAYSNYYTLVQRYRLAIPYLEGALADQLALDPTDLARMVIRRSALASGYVQTGRFDDALRLDEAALASIRRAEAHPGTLTGIVEQRYGAALFMASRDAAARPMLEAAHRDLVATSGSDFVAADALTFLGWLELRAGRIDEARATLRQAYQDQRTTGGGPQHWATQRARACLGLAEIAGGEVEAGLAELSAAVEAYEQRAGRDIAEAQLFRLLLLEQQVAHGRAPADRAAVLARLDPQRIVEAAPWLDVRAHLTELRAAAQSPFGAAHAVTVSAVPPARR